MPQALARLVIGASELDADLFYLTNFRAPDPFIYLESEGRTTLLMSDLEVDRAKAHARVDEVLSLSHYQEKAKQKNDNGVPSSLQALHTLLQERRITKLEVPATFAIEAGDYLRGEGYTVTFPSGAFVGSRACKSEDEVARIREVQQATELAMGVAIEAVRNADVSNGMLLEAGHPLTAEAIKKRIALLLMDEGCTAKNTIVACGDQACDPHNEGTGPLEAGMPIVIDIFPRSDISGYYADTTRTVIKGEPTDEQSKLYATVEAGHSLVLERIVAGADGMDIHAAVLELFESAGYRTGEIDGRMQGFFHGTGHGLGLEIHEPPRISRSSQKLIEGHVVTVEPGLYYPGIGGVRIEDLVVVRSDGCENLTTYPKVFQV